MKIFEEKIHNYQMIYKDEEVDKQLRTVWSWTRAQLKRGGEGVDFEFYTFLFVFVIGHCKIPVISIGDTIRA